MTNSLRLMRTVAYYEILLAWRRKAECANTVVFFIIVVALFPLGVGPDATLLTLMGPGVIWVAALLATLLALPRIFSSDLQDGMLEQYLTSGQPLSLIVLAKVTAHWLMTGLPLLLITPVLALFMHLSLHECGMLMLSLLLGTPMLSLIGAIGVALTAGLRNAGVLLALLMLPLYVPILIFGTGVALRSAQGLPVGGLLALLAAGLALALALSPMATAAALRLGLI